MLWVGCGDYREIHKGVRRRLYKRIRGGGSYDRTSGLSARLLLRKPANEGSERDFQVSAKRRFERLSSSIDTLESGND